MTMHLESERAALMRTSREWAQAAAGGDLERIVSFWADDAMVLPPDLPAVVGKAAIREFVRASQAVPGFSVTWEPEAADVSADGTVGYLVERNRFTLPDASGVVRAQHGKAVTVWRKDSTGAWKCVIDTWNSEPREQAPASPVRNDPVEQVKAVVRTHEAAVRARDLTAILANAADDAVALVPGAPLAVGRDAIRALYDQVLQMGAWDFSHDYSGAEVSGDLVILHGVARGTLTPAGGSPAAFANNFLLTFKRQSDGRYRFWRVAFGPAAG